VAPDGELPEPEAEPGVEHDPGLEKAVKQALAQLPEAQREAIDLAFFSGMTQVEISDKLGAPLGTVKARIRRGLLALRSVLEPSAS
jgi:RNA polymerase sigma-70 factor (ECF subfamily)